MKAVLEGVEGPAEQTGQRFKFRLDDGTRVLVSIAIESGRIIFPAVEVIASDMASEVPDLRHVPIGAMREQVRLKLTGSGPGTASLLDGRAFLAELHRGAGHEVPEHLTAAEKATRAAVESLRERKGRPRITDEFLREVALAWISAVAIAPRGARAVLADEFGYSTDSAARWVRLARKAGWLAETTAGRTGAEPGPRLIEWLNEGETE